MMGGAVYTVLFLLLTSTNGLVVRPVAAVQKETSTIALERPAELFRKSTDDPTAFGWVKKLAAIGDSFTAGIGSGTLLGGVFHDKESWTCSRYDHSYPMLVNDMLGPSVDEFKFAACSGDRSVQIYDQVDSLSNDQDLVIMTAGGNDLCLAAMIKKCVFLSYEGEDSCTAVINKASENIVTILKPNLKSILLHLATKMATDGIVVFNGYAQFFNTETEHCATDQDWSMNRIWFKYWFKSALKLTIARRQLFNDLVLEINLAIKSVIEDVEDEVGYKIGFSDWDLWAIEGVKGQMCDPGGSGNYPDSLQPELQFFKPDTRVISPLHDGLKKREGGVEIEFRKGGSNPGIDPSIYNTLLWKSSNPAAEVKHKLDKRAPSPPGCPGDSDWIDPTMGLGLPDSFGKLFHPNELGHETIASFAIQKVIGLRAKVLGVAPEICEVKQEFKCWQTEGRRGYATADRMNENYIEFCNSVVQPHHEVGWKFEKTYYPNTPDEHSFLLQLDDSVADFNKEVCLSSFERIINSCDGNDPENPLNWKFGGRYKLDQYTHEINVKRTNRPWPPIKAAAGICSSQYKVVLSSFEIRGRGFVSWHHQKLFDSIKSCISSSPSWFKFWYFDEPDKDGMEWQTSFNTPIWENSRCFKNNKVVQGAGGFTDGCAGSG